jgi:adenylate kinase
MAVLNLVIFGPPGAGKGTQSEAIKARYDVFHLSTGDMLREAIKNETETGKLAQQYTNSGKLVPDEVVIKIVDEKVAGIDKAKGLLFDGFPRTLDQAVALDALLKSNGREVSAVIYLNVPDEEVVQRLTGRRMCPSCNSIYHVVGMPPKKEGICDKCNAELIQRKDDNETVIRQRLEAYHAQTQPLYEYYNKKGLIKEVGQTGSADETSRMIFKYLD